MAAADVLALDFCPCRDVLHEHGFGQDVQTYLKRTRAIPRSSNSPAAERPLVPIHLESIEAEWVKSLEAFPIDGDAKECYVRVPHAVTNQDWEELERFWRRRDKSAVWVRDFELSRPFQRICW